MKLLVKVTNKKTLSSKVIDTSLLSPKEFFKLILGYAKSENFKIEVFFEWLYMKMSLVSMIMYM